MTLDRRNRIALIAIIVTFLSLWGCITTMLVTFALSVCGGQ